MKKQRWAIICLAILGAVFSVVSCPSFAADPIKIGLVDSYTGPPSVYCNDVKDGFKLALDEINAKGGVLGRQLVFVTRDDKFKVDLGLSAARELIMRENVDILAGTTNSAVTLAVSDVVKKEKIPFVVMFAKSAKITGAKGHRYIFSLNENTAMIGRAAAIALSKRPYVNYWIAGDDYEFGHAMGSEIWSNLKKLKPEVNLMGESWWKVGEPDIIPYITSILSVKPDAVIMATGGAGCVPFLKTAKATGFNQKVPFLMHTAIELSTLKPLGAEAPEGVLGTSPYLFYYPDTPENKAFVENYKKKYNNYPSVASFCGYISGQFIAKAFEKAGAVDREKFVDALAGMTLDSPVGKLTIREFDHQLMLPMFVGVTKSVPGYDFLMADKIETIPAADIMPTVEEIKKAREE
jgi:branched-chain amino acid transport system substrate-binding protein